LILIIGVVGLDCQFDLTIYLILLIIASYSSRRLLPTLIPLPAAFFIIGINYLFIRDPKPFVAARFYFATAFALSYTAMTSAEEIASGISWFLSGFGIRIKQDLYILLATVKSIDLKKVSWRDLPSWMGTLLTQKIDPKRCEGDSCSPQMLDFVAAILTGFLIILVLRS